jgi:endonuclease III-like uncharacterized protein
LPFFENSEFKYSVLLLKSISVFQSIQMLKTSKAKCRTINQATIEKLVEIIKVDNYYSQHAWFYLAMIDIVRGESWGFSF